MPTGPEKTTRPADEDGDFGAQGLEVVHPVAGEHDRGAVGGQAVEHAVHVLLARRVQAVGRLVQHQEPGLGQQRGGQSEALAHAEREAADLVVGDLGQPDVGQGLVDARGARVAVPEPGERGKVLLWR